jgi:hypothetical protein
MLITVTNPLSLQLQDEMQSIIPLTFFLFNHVIVLKLYFLFRIINHNLLQEMSNILLLIAHSIFSYILFLKNLEGKKRLITKQLAFLNWRQSGMLDFLSAK